MVCTDCHNPHGGPYQHQLLQPTTNEVCYTCHAEKRMSRNKWCGIRQYRGTAATVTIRMARPTCFCSRFRRRGCASNATSVPFIPARRRAPERFSCSDTPVPIVMRISTDRTHLAACSLLASAMHARGKYDEKLDESRAPRINPAARCSRVCACGSARGARAGDFGAGFLAGNRRGGCLPRAGARYQCREVPRIQRPRATSHRSGIKSVGWRRQG